METTDGHEQKKNCNGVLALVRSVDKLMGGGVKHRP